MIGNNSLLMGFEVVSRLNSGRKFGRLVGRAAETVRRFPNRRDPCALWAEPRALVVSKIVHPTVEYAHKPCGFDLQRGRIDLGSCA